MPVNPGYDVYTSSIEYYTPAKYVNAAREVMGSIDLDPASCEIANKVVQATRYYTKEADGFLLPWYGRIFLNPPFGKIAGDRSSQARWSGKLIDEYRQGNVEQAVLLCNPSDTASKWFHRLLAYPHCFTDHRIAFYRYAIKQVDRGMVGSLFTYFGPEPERFYEVFSQFGTCEPPARIRTIPTLF